MTTNNDELREAVSIVDELIQETQKHLGQDPYTDGKIRFPRNFIRTAGHVRSRLSFIRDKNINKRQLLNERDRRNKILLANRRKN